MKVTVADELFGETTIDVAPLVCGTCGKVITDDERQMFASDGSLMHERCAVAPVFVYGTLRTGGAIGMLDCCKQRVSATITGTMVSVADAYPAVDTNGAGTIVGEIVFVDLTDREQRDALQRTHDMERGAGYDMRVRTATTSTGDQVGVFVWHQAAAGRKVIDSGDWLAYAEQVRPAVEPGSWDAVDADEFVLVRGSTAMLAAAWWVGYADCPEYAVSPAFPSPTPLGAWCRDRDITLADSSVEVAGGPINEGDLT